MGKIYRRKTLVSGVKKKKDDNNRKRNVIINFRVSPEEKRIIEERIALSGLLKSEYYIQSCMYQKITAYGNVKSFDAINKRMEIIDQHLCEIQRSDELEQEILESLRMILEILDGLYGEK